MDSRFWGRGSDSEDDSEDEVSDSEEEEESDASDSDSDSSDNDDAAGRFLAGSDSDSEEEDKRVVRSAKDKRFEELSKSCDEMRNKMKVNDWSSIQTVFEKLQKQLEKAMKTANLSSPPRVYIAILCELEDCLNSTLANKEVKKKMSPTNAKALNTMKQRLRKYLPEHDASMAAWRENPVLDDTEEEEESEEESEDEDGEPADEDGIKRREKKRDELLSMNPEKITYEMVSDKARYIAQARGKRGTDRQEQLEMLQFLAKVAKGPVQRIEVLMQYISTLFDLSINLNTSIPVHVWQRAARAMFQVFNLLDANPHIVLDETLEVVVERTEEPPTGEEFRILGNVRAFIERLDDELFKILQLTDSHTTEYIARLREEPILLALADKAIAYFQRVKDTRNVAFVSLRQAEHFYYKTESVYAAMRNLVEASKASGVDPGDVKATPTEPVATGAENKSARANGIEVNGTAAAGGEAVELEENFTDSIKLPIPQDFQLPECCHALMQSLVQTIYLHGDERSKARAVLTHIYHKCIHDDFHSARDALLMSHLQDQVHSMDVPTMIMYNRAMTQLGLCAFRSGLIQESHACLAELYGSNRIRELLAQGMSLNRYQEKTPEQEKLERRRQMPFHMHINLEMVEAVYLTCAALLEIPNIAAKPIPSTRFVISKPFLRLLETYRNQVFTGPPESVRDHIMAAARALSRGDWEKAFKFITALKMWTLMPNRAAVTDMLKAKLKKEGLRTYLFAYSSQYKALSLRLLSEMFQMTEKEVSGTVSAMMMANELPGSWDQPTSAIVMRNLEESRLQKLASQVSERALQLVELNERALAFRTGSLRDDGDHDGDGGGHKGRRRRDGDWDDHGFMRKGGRGGRGGRGRGGRRDRDDRGDYGDRRRGGRHGDMGGGMRRRDGGFGGGRRDRMVGSGHFMTLGGGGGNRNDRGF